MKQSIRLLSLLLSIAMVFSMLACDNSEPTTTTETTVTTEPVETTEATIASEPSAADIYNAAKAKLDSATDISLSVNSTTYTTVAGNQFSEQSAMTLTYRDIGSENASILEEEELTHGIHLQADKEDDKAEPTKYTEIWANGNVYAELDEIYRTTTAMDAESAKKRYVPVTILDASLYGTVTQETADGGARILFTDATAGESWLIPEYAELQEASGSALVSTEGTLTEMTYDVTFTLGSAQYKMEISSKPLAETKEITVPTDADAYTVTEDANALYIYASLDQKIWQASSYSTDSTDSVFTQAGAFGMNTFSRSTVCKTDSDLMVKMKTDVHYNDYSEQTNESESMELIYRDGKVTITENGGLPTINTVKRQDMEERIDQLIILDVLSPEYWSDVSTTYFGNLCLFEFTFNDDFGNNRHNELCTSLFGSSTALYEIASEYKNGELSGYFSVDLFTGLPVSLGILYEGYHTIEGEECILIHQSDNAFNIPNIGAYKEITEELPETTEPETKPTPLFYKVTGENGQQMWLLGTVHIGDERTAYMPQELKDAFDASDALALEITDDDYEKELEENPQLAEKIDSMYFFSGEDDLSTVLDEQDYADLVKLQKALGVYDAHSDAYTLSATVSILRDAYDRMDNQFHGDWGVDNWLENWAKEQEKPIYGIESVMSHIELEYNWPYETQYCLLSSAVMETPESWRLGVSELYELWCAGDEAAIRESCIPEEVNVEELTEEEKAEYEQYKPFMDEYDKLMIFDRNAAMLEKAIEYLESGEVVFYAVGYAHLFEGGNGLVDTLREAGYTVEQVTYAQ